eukprot:CAMPEP_0118633458 /NCGR_PEP_ID=MMETSP0785-20121206/1008_1 /TAXON_ID=91992 /ORGANISM="Bolidomonas pacifica, Strain CCMP 1866" /LENGTH=247 /DNA_ID=CAMNT_0006524335 /DNA_START=15 /DNA_END=754 /DNA_ORIENTATION=+
MKASNTFKTIKLSNPLKSRKGVVLITIYAPNNNAFTNLMYTELTDAINTNNDADAIIFTHEGKYFTTGVDFLDQFTHLTPSSYSTSLPTLPVYKFMLAIISCPSLLILTLTGPIIGIGATLLLHCDYVLSSSNSMGYLWYPFTRACLPPEFGSSLLLTRRLGRTRATGTLAFGERMSFKDAELMGLLKIGKTANPFGEVIEMLKGLYTKNHNFGESVRRYVALTRLNEVREVMDAVTREFEVIRERV